MKIFKILLFVFFSTTIYCQTNFHKLNDSTKLYIKETGKGQTLLFIPGWKMTHRFFEHQLDGFSNDFHVITYDPRGQGKSDKSNDKNNYMSHAKDLNELILNRELKDIILVGWSSGCLTMYEYLRLFGSTNISRLIFIDEPPKWIGDVNTEWVYGSFEDYRSSLKGLISKPANPDEIINWMFKNPINEESKSWMRKEMLLTPEHIALSLYIDGIASDFTKEVKNIDVPALYLVRESWYKYAKGWLTKYIPHAQVKSISSHAMFWEEPKKFNSILKNFIR